MPTWTLLQDLAAQVAAAVQFQQAGQQHTVTVSPSFRPQAVWRALQLLDAGDLSMTCAGQAKSLTAPKVPELSVHRLCVTGQRQQACRRRACITAQPSAVATLL